MREVPFPKMPKSEYKLRVAKGQELMKKYGIDALLLFTPSNVRYYTGLVKASTVTWDVKRRTAIFPRDRDPALVVVGQEGIAAKTTWVEDIRGARIGPGRTYDWSFTSEKFVQVFVDTIKDLKLDNKVLGTKGILDPHFAGVFAPDISYQDMEAIRRSLPDAKFLDSYDLEWEQRLIKTDYEKQIFRECCNITMKAWQKGMDAVEVGVSEWDLWRIIWQTLLSEGLQEDVLHGRITMDTEGTVSCGPKDRILKKGDQASFNGGACHKGYHSDTTRNVHLGEPSETWKILYEGAQKATEAGIEAVRPGGKIADMYSAAFKVTKQVHPELEMPRLIGHGIGVDSHEPPYITSYHVPYIKADTLVPGMIFTVEVPLIYKGLKANVEDDILVTEDGCENLTPPEKMPHEVLIKY